MTLSMSRYISPQYWMSFPIISGEISNIKTFHCPSNPKITDDNVNIIKQVSWRKNIQDKENIQNLNISLLKGRLWPVQWSAGSAVFLPDQPGAGDPHRGAPPRHHRRQPGRRAPGLHPGVLRLQADPGQEEGTQKQNLILMYKSKYSFKS